MKSAVNNYFVICIACILFFNSCGKGDSGGGGAPSPCAGVNVTVDGIVTSPSASGASDGSIVASATGSTGFSYSINGGTFQSSGTFSNLASGTYTITARNTSNCSGSRSFTLIAQNNCTGVTITVSGVTTSNTPCTGSGTGSITVSNTGGVAPFTFSVDGTAFQSSNVFNNVSSGTHSVFAKDANGCTGNASIVVNDVAQGPLFTAVRNMMQTNCILSGCHADIQPPFFSDPCLIVANRFLIKDRAVDANPSVMPPTGPLPAAEKQKITDWLNAGGKYSN